MSVSQTVTPCSLVYSLHFFDEGDSVWTEYKLEENGDLYSFVASFDAERGTLEILTSDFEAYYDFSVRAKIVATDLKSGTMQSSVEEVFEITVKDRCLDAVITQGVTGFTGTEAEPYDWDMYQMQEITFPPIQVNFADCPVVYRILDANQESSELSKIYNVPLTD